MAKISSALFFYVPNILSVVVIAILPFTIQTRLLNNILSLFRGDADPICGWATTVIYSLVIARRSLLYGYVMASMSAIRRKFGAWTRQFFSIRWLIWTNIGET